MLSRNVMEALVVAAEVTSYFPTSTTDPSNNKRSIRKSYPRSLSSSSGRSSSNTSLITMPPTTSSLKTHTGHGHKNKDQERDHSRSRHHSGDYRGYHQHRRPRHHHAHRSHHDLSPGITTPTPVQQSSEASTTRAAEQSTHTNFLDRIRPSFHTHPSDLFAPYTFFRDLLLFGVFLELRHKAHTLLSCFSDQHFHACGQFLNMQS